MCSGLAFRAVQSGRCGRNLRQPVVRSGLASRRYGRMPRTQWKRKRPTSRFTSRPVPTPFPRKSSRPITAKSRDLLRASSTAPSIYKRQPSMFMPSRRPPLPPCPPQRPPRMSWSSVVAALVSPSLNPSQRAWITLSTTSSSLTCVPT